MKLYRVKVNGKVYEVELEAVSEQAGSIVAESKPTESASTTGGATIVAPIAGKVLDVKVAVGDSIKVGQTVAVIEAMKLENEVPATASGVVAEIKVTKGASVNNKDVIVVLK